MGESRKHRNRRRQRDKLAKRSLTKVQQIKLLQNQLDNYKIHPLTGQVIWPETKEN